MIFMVFITALFLFLTFSLFIYYVIESNKRERGLLEFYLIGFQKTIIDSVQICLNHQAVQLESWLTRILSEQSKYHNDDNDPFGDDDNEFSAS